MLTASTVHYHVAGTKNWFQEIQYVFAAYNMKFTCYRLNSNQQKSNTLITKSYTVNIWELNAASSSKNS